MIIHIDSTGGSIALGLIGGLAVIGLLEVGRLLGLYIKHWRKP